MQETIVKHMKIYQLIPQDKIPSWKKKKLQKDVTKKHIRCIINFGKVDIIKGNWFCNLQILRRIYLKYSKKH